MNRAQRRHREGKSSRRARPLPPPLWITRGAKFGFVRPLAVNRQVAEDREPSPPSNAFHDCSLQVPDPGFQVIAFQDHHIWIMEAVGEQGHALKGSE